MDQAEFAESINPIHIPRNRRQDPKAATTEEEKTALRAITGSLQYAAVHTRPDLAAKVGELQSATSQSTVEVLLQANRVLHEGKVHKNTHILIPSIPRDWISYCLFSDAAFASNKSNSSHQGCIIFSNTPHLQTNQTTVVCPVAWSSKKIPRVVKSTLAAEAYAFSSSLDRLGWIRVFWAWLKNPTINWRKPEIILQHENPACAVTDCKSSYDLCVKTNIPSCSEQRTTLECFVIRERLKENVLTSWIHSKGQLADCLTKAMDSRTLRDCLASGTYSLYDEGETLKDRATKREAIGWYKQRAANTESDNPAAYPTKL